MQATVALSSTSIRHTVVNVQADVKRHVQGIWLLENRKLAELFAALAATSS